MSPYTLTEAQRAEIMVRIYGEVCTAKTACTILSVSTRTLTKMIKDGKIARACEGKKIDVRSMAWYIAHQAEADEQVRKEKMMRKHASRYAV